MDAAEFGMGELLRIVAEAESDLNANTGGETALREALNGRNAGRWTAAEIANIIALLLNNGADATATVVEVNSQNESALDLLAQLKDEANFADGLAATLAELLLAAGGECQTETDADPVPDRRRRKLLPNRRRNPLRPIRRGDTLRRRNLRPAGRNHLHRRPGRNLFGRLVGRRLPGNRRCRRRPVRHQPQNLRNHPRLRRTGASQRRLRPRKC